MYSESNKFNNLNKIAIENKNEKPQILKDNRTIPAIGYGNFEARNGLFFGPGRGNN